MTNAPETLLKVKSMKAAFKASLLDSNWEKIKELDVQLRSLMADAVKVVTSGLETDAVLQVELRDEVKTLIETYTTCIMPDLEAHQDEIKSQIRELNTTKKGIDAYHPNTPTYQIQHWHTAHELIQW